MVLVNMEIMNEYMETFTIVEEDFYKLRSPVVIQREDREVHQGILMY